MDKLGSRKFWMCVVAFCGSVATSIAALQSTNDVVAGIGVAAGIVAAAASAVVYVVTEGSIDRAAIESNANTTVTTKTVTATASDKATVSAAFNPAPSEASKVQNEAE